MHLVEPSLLVEVANLKGLTNLRQDLCFCVQLVWQCAQGECYMVHLRKMGLLDLRQREPHRLVLSQRLLLQVLFKPPILLEKVELLEKRASKVLVFSEGSHHGEASLHEPLDERPVQEPRVSEKSTQEESWGGLFSKSGEWPPASTASSPRIARAASGL